MKWFKTAYMNKILYYLQWNQDLTLTHTFIHSHDLTDFVVISTGDAFIFTVYKSMNCL
jgi:hypothetical protein